jgi:hypothetical protein
VAGDETLAVVHLVRSGTPSDVLARFLDSYRRHDAGVDHRFVLLLKGFGDTAELDAIRRAVADLPAEEVQVPDDGFDLRAYFTLVRQTRHGTLCFLNSFSVIRVDGWLESLAAAIRTPGIGLAGATGSWASPRSHTLFDLGLPSAYARFVDDRERFRATFTANGSSLQIDAPSPLVRRARFVGHVLDQVWSFDGFPCPHIRTNGFIARRATLAGIRPGRLLTKRDHYHLESGRRGLTAQLAEIGLRTVVCGADGSIADPPRWAATRTFWQGDQENLLISDNRTEAYASADENVRLQLSRSAWGLKACPARLSGRDRQ